MWGLFPSFGILLLGGCFWEGTVCERSLHDGPMLFGGAPKERRSRRAEKRSSKRVFWRVRFFSSHLGFPSVFRANLTGAEKKRTLQKHPFGESVSPHDAFSAPLAHPHKLFAICRATPYCHENVAQLSSSLSKARGVATLWRHLENPDLLE